MLNALQIENFPRTLTYIFVAIGYEITIMHVEDKSELPFKFLKNLKEWMNMNLEDILQTQVKKIHENDTDTEGPARYMGYSTPVIVAITIPEVSLLFLKIN